MIVPSIDLMNGRAVQLIGGREKVIDAGDPRPLAAAFGRVGEVAVIDLDAALGRGDNTDVIRSLLHLASCRVGGGIRSRERAIEWLDAGASRVILGTAAEPDLLRSLPRDRVIAALDARHDRVVVNGWTRTTAHTVHERMAVLRDHVGGFLVTFVEREGQLTGLPFDRITALRAAAGDAQLTIAGGVADANDIAEADRRGADAQVGMSLYTGAIDLAEGFCAPLRSDRPDGLWPTIVESDDGTTLGLVYSNLDSVRAMLTSGRGTYYSRSRNSLWEKGATSGNTQQVRRLDVDCDRDALRVVVRQNGAFCHTGFATCFGAAHGLARLDQTLVRRRDTAPSGSYTARLFDDDALLAAKLREEAEELIDAQSPAHAACETADLLYFALVAARKRGASLVDVMAELDRRAGLVTRRPGHAKPAAPASASTTAGDNR